MWRECVGVPQAGSVRLPRPSTSSLRGAVVALVAALALGAAGCVPVTDAAAPEVDPAVARRQLGELTVAKAGSMRGYSRDRFRHWGSAGTNCDVRDTVLSRDGEDVRLRGCNVVAGRWLSWYDNRTVTDPSTVDVDHMVPLANAWRSGAAKWRDARREAFANDLTRPQLIAVSRSSNRAKGDQDPAQWKPVNRAYWCRYAQDWITVKRYWGLSVTRAEKTALTKMLETCRWPSKAA
jgi:hypothetical protein